MVSVKSSENKCVSKCILGATLDDAKASMMSFFGFGDDDAPRSAEVAGAQNGEILRERSSRASALNIIGGGTGVKQHQKAAAAARKTTLTDLSSSGGNKPISSSDKRRLARRTEILQNGQVEQSNEQFAGANTGVDDSDIIGDFADRSQARSTSRASALNIDECSMERPQGVKQNEDVVDSEDGEDDIESEEDEEYESDIEDDSLPPLPQEVENIYECRACHEQLSDLLAQRRELNDKIDEKYDKLKRLIDKHSTPLRRSKRPSPPPSDHQSDTFGDFADRAQARSTSRASALNIDECSMERPQRVKQNGDFADRALARSTSRASAINTLGGGSFGAERPQGVKQNGDNLDVTLANDDAEPQTEIASFAKQQNEVKGTATTSRRNHHRVNNRSRKAHG